MRILFFSRLYLPHIGGVELHIQNLVQILQKDNFITIVTEQYDWNLPLYEKTDFGEIYRIPLRDQHTSKKDIWKWMFIHIPLILQSDLIHFHDVFFWILPLYPVLWWKKMYITFHGYEGNKAPTDRQRFWHQLAAKLTRGNICIGGFHSKWYGVTPTFTSFGAVGSRFLHHKKNKPAQTKVTRLAYIGRLSPDTGILAYLFGFQEYLQKHKQPLILDVYGDGPQVYEAKKYVKTHKLPVRFNGFVDTNLIPWETYQLTFVSRYLSILESLALGIPIIAHADEKIKEDYLALSPFVAWITIAHTGNEISNAIQSSLSSPHNAESQAWARQQTWKEMVNLYLLLWKR